MANRNLRTRVGNTLFTVCVFVGLLISPDHTTGSRDIAAPQQVASSRGIGAYTREMVTVVENHENKSLVSAVREAAAADAEAANALADYEDAKKVLEGKRMDVEGISADAFKVRSQADEIALDRALMTTDVAELAEWARKRSADLKRASEVAEKAGALAAGKRKVADEASAAVGEAARLAEAARTAGAQLALERAKLERAEAVRAAEEAETVADEATENAEDAWEAYSQEVSDVEVSVVDIESEEIYIEDLKTAAARLDEEYRKSVTAMEVAKAKVEKLKGLAEEKVARAKAMRAALRKGGKSNGRDATTATQ
ncbi:unnamed protein product [Closterium sp. NIES-54]